MSLSIYFFEFISLVFGLLSHYFCSALLCLNFSLSLKLLLNLSADCNKCIERHWEPASLDAARASILFMHLGEAAAGSWRATRLIGVHEARITYATACGRNRNVDVRFRFVIVCCGDSREKLIEQRVITAADNYADRLYVMRRFAWISRVKAFTLIFFVLLR